MLFMMLAAMAVALSGISSMSFADTTASTSEGDAVAQTGGIADTPADEDDASVADQEGGNDTARQTAALAAYQQDLADLRQNTLVEDDIYDDELIERYGEEWEAQFASSAEFRQMMFALRAYTTMDIQENGWNEAMVQIHTKIHNFDTIIEKTGFGHEITSLVVTKQKLQGQYNHTGPIKIFHDWLAEKYPAPDSVDAIDDRLGEIISESEFVTFAPDVADAFNTLAQHGNVPDALFENDTKYWNVVVNIAACGYSEGCDADALRKILDTKVYEKDPGPPPEVASNWLSLILPSAYAWSETPHYTIMYGEPHTCTYGTCKVKEEIPWSAGEHRMTLSPPDTSAREGAGHGTSNYMKIHISSCSHIGSYNYAIATLEIGGNEQTHTTSGLGCAKLTKNVLASDRDDPSYVWYLTGTTNAWTS